MRILLTGGCGFIGSAVVRHLVRNTGHDVTTLDKMTYAASRDALEEVREHARHRIIEADVADGRAVRDAFATSDPDWVMHLAAETHVDRSIDGPAPFIQSNVVGTFTMLEAAREHWQGLPAARRAGFRFHHVSTDEVFGALGPDDHLLPRRRPTTRAAPTPRARLRPITWSAPGTTPTGCRPSSPTCSNNYGPWQFPEKLIPLVILNALARQAAAGLWRRFQCARLALRGRSRGGAGPRAGARRAGRDAHHRWRQMRSNLDVVRGICAALDALRPDPAGPRERLIRFVADRPGHDFRYEIDPVPRRGPAGLARAARLRGGAAPDRAVVSRQRALVAGHPRPALRRRAVGYGRMKGILLAGGSGTRLHPDDAGREQAAPARLRQADGVLSALGADAGRHPRHPRHPHTRGPARLPPPARRRGADTACASAMPSKSGRTASPRLS